MGVYNNNLEKTDDFMKKAKSIYSTVIILFCGILLAILLKLFALDFLTIRGTSMSPALKDNQLVWINKGAYGLLKPGSQDYLVRWKEPQKNDLVIFLHNNKIVVKRVILTSNDYLEILYDSDYNSYYIKVGNRKVNLSREQKNLFENGKQVPEGFVFVLGDNDENSVDSRDYGFVSVKNITGRVVGK